MRVLFHLPFRILRRANGGITVFNKTREYLQRSGVEVDLFDPWRSDLANYDLVHAFSMESTDMWEFAKAYGSKLAVTPISWLGLYASRRSRVTRSIKRMFRSRFQCPLHGYWWEDCFGFPDVFFPQSVEQANQLSTAFKVPQERVHVVRHGVDARFARGDPSVFTRKYGLSDFVLCVARVEPRKNQLSLVRALKGTGTPLVIIGRPDSPRLQWYYDRCEEEADRSVLFIDELPHDSPMLESAYAAARVFVLPSLLEFPGLAFLEAGLAGCRVVGAKTGAVFDYLGEYASYLDPRSVHSIRETVLNRYASAVGRDVEIQDHVRRNFLWEAVVQENIAGYRRVLDKAG